MPSRTILVVEEDLIYREGLRSLLEEAGYPVAVAANPAEAEERLGRGPLPALILFDIHLRSYEGTIRQFFRWRDRFAGPCPPVIMLSGLDGMAAGLAQALGACGYLQKPLDADRLLAEVRRWLGP